MSQRGKEKFKYIYHFKCAIKIWSYINSGMHFKDSLQYENGYKLLPSSLLYEDFKH